MSKIFKLASALLGVVAFIMMFLPQVVVNWASDPSETLAIKALTGGTFHTGTEINPTGAGLAGYILVLVGAFFVLLTALLKFFKEHEVLDYILLGIAVICVLIGIILIFLIRKNFANANGGLDCSMGAGMIIAGIASILSCLTGGIALAIDIIQ